MAYVETRPVLVCTDEDVTVEAKSAWSDDLLVHVRLCIRFHANEKLEVAVPAGVWREWVREVEKSLKREERNNREVRDDDESDDV